MNRWILRCDPTARRLASCGTTGSAGCHCPGPPSPPASPPRPPNRPFAGLGLLPAEPGHRPARTDPDHTGPAPSAPKRPRRNWSALRDDVVRLYGEGRTIRAIATELGMHHREVWRQLEAAGVARRARGTTGVVLSRSALQRLYIHDQLSVAEVARRFEVSTGAVVRNLRSYGLPRHDRHAPLDRDTLRRLYVDERLGVRAVASRLGVSPDKVRVELARYRIPIRRPGRPSRPG